MDPITTTLPPSPAPQMPRRSSDLAGTAREFEAVFVGQITKLMMEMVETDDGFSGGHAEEMFRGILAEQMGNEIAKRGNFGLAPAVMEQMIKMQEGAARGQ